MLSSRKLSSQGFTSFLKRYFSSSADSNNGKYPISVDNINKNVFDAEYSVRGYMSIRAERLRSELRAGESLPFTSVIACNVGNPLAVGKKPLTFARQLLSAIHSPDLIKEMQVPDEVKDRAHKILDATGGEIGAYTPIKGYKFVIDHVAEFIRKRDGIQINPNNIYISNGVSDAVSKLFTLIINDSNIGIMCPNPGYPLYTAEAVMRNGKIVPYLYRESANWSLDFSQLVTSLEHARKADINVKALVVVNPGNPTGLVLSTKEMRAIIEFCENNNILLIADEVYQDDVYDQKRPFYSFRRIAKEMRSEVQLVSLHSISKGFMGECGHRGGYMDLYHFGDKLKKQFDKMYAVSLCPNVTGQILVDVMCNPPESEECSRIWNEEKNEDVEGRARRAKMMFDGLNNMPGIKCQPCSGSWYLFPRLDLPLKALEVGKLGKFDDQKYTPDLFWCLELLEETGVAVVPGCGFGQTPGTYHFRTSILPNDSDVKATIEKVHEFQTRFMTKYS